MTGLEVGRVEAGLYLKKDEFDRGLNEAEGSLQRVAGKIDSAAEKMGAAGQTLTMGVTLPIVGLAAGVVKLSGDFEQSMANVASVTGGGADAMERLSRVARDAGASTVFSASEAADAMYYMASAGWDADKITAGLADTLKLAAAGGKDLAFTSDLMTATISQFGLEANDAGRVANVFAAATAGSQANLDKLAYSMRYVGPVAQSLGWSVESSTAALMGLYNAGFKGEQAGTILRGALTNLMNPSKAVTDELTRLKININDVNPATHSLADILDTLSKAGIDSASAMKIFGVEAGPGMLALLSQGGDAIREYEKSITGTQKATEMMETQTNTLWGAMKQLRSAGEELALVFGDVLIPPLTSFVKDTVTPFVRRLGEMDQGMVKLIVTIAAAAAVVGPLLIAFSLMLPALSLLLAPIAAVGVAFVGLVTGAAAMAVGVVASFASMVVGVAVSVAAIAAAVVAGYVPVLATYASMAVAVIAHHARMAAGAIAHVVAMQSIVISHFLTMKSKAIAAALLTEAAILASYAKMATSTIASVALMSASVAVHFVATKVTAVTSAAIMAAGVIAHYVSMAISSAASLAGMVAKTLAGFAVMAAGALAHVARMAAGVVASFVMMAAGALAPVAAMLAPILLIGAAIGGMVAAFGGLDKGSVIKSLQKIGDAVKDIWSSLSKGDYKGAFTKLTTHAKSAKDTIVNYFRTLDWHQAFASAGDILVQSLSGAYSKLRDLGSHVVDGIKNIDWGGVWDGLSNVGSKIVDGIKGIDWGGIGATLRSSLSGAWDSVTNLGATIKDKILAINWHGVGDTIIGAIGAGFAAVVNIGSKIKDSITSVNWSGVGDKIISGIQTALGAASTIGSAIADKIRGVNWSGVGQTIISGIQGAFQTAQNLGSYLADKIKGEKWDSVGAWAVDKISGAFKSAVNFGSALIDKVKALPWKDAADTAREKITDAWNRYQGWAEGVRERFKNTMTDFADGGGAYAIGVKIGDAIANAFSTIKALGEKIGSAISGFFQQGGAQNVGQQIGTAFSNIAEWAGIGWNIISGIFKGIWDGMSPMANELKADFLNLFADIISSIPGADRVLGGSIEDIRTRATEYEARAAERREKNKPITDLSWTEATRYRTPEYTPVGTWATASNLGGVTKTGYGGSQAYSRTVSTPSGPISIPTGPQGYAITKTTTSAEIMALARKLKAHGIGEEEGKEIIKELSSADEAVTARLGGLWRSPEFAGVWSGMGTKVGIGAEGLFGTPTTALSGGGSAEAVAPILDRIAVGVESLHDTTGATAENTAPIGLGIASTGNIFRTSMDGLNTQMGGLAGWMSRMVSAQEAEAAAATYQPGQIISKADVAGFANAVTYAISPETGKLTAYIGSAGKELEKLAINGGQEILNAATVSGSTTISSAQRAAVIQEQSYQQAGIAQLSSVYASGSVFQNAATLSGQRITSAAEVAAVTQTTAANVGAVTQTNAANMFGQTVTGGGNSFLGSVDQSRAGWLSDVISSGGSFGRYTDVAGAGFGAYTDTAGVNFEEYITNSGKQFSEVILAVFARIFGGGGGGGGSSASSAGYSMLSSAQNTLNAARALGLQTEYLVETCLGTTVAVNALLYTNPAGYSYSINPLNYHSTGGVSSYMSATTGVQGLYSSGGKTPVKLGKYAGGGVAIGPQLAIVGDNPSRKEAIIPEEVWGSGKSARQVVEVYLDGRKITAGVASRMQREIPSVANMRTH